MTRFVALLLALFFTSQLVSCAGTESGNPDQQVPPTPAVMAMKTPGWTTARSTMKTGGSSPR